MNTTTCLLTEVMKHLRKFYEDDYDPRHDQELLELVGNNRIKITIGSKPGHSDYYEYTIDNYQVTFKKLHYRAMNYEFIELTKYDKPFGSYK